MFEKEAEERARKLEESQTLGIYDNEEDYARDRGWNEGEVTGYEEGFIDGAEFGYNKYKEELNQKGLALQSDMDKTIEQNIALKKELNKANEWHYVKDGLPELYKDVLVVFPRGDCDVKHLTNHNEWVGRGSWCSLSDVIAWKEIVLPKEIE